MVHLCTHTEKFTIRVREMEFQLFVTIYTLSIYPCAHKQLRRRLPNPSREFPCKSTVKCYSPISNLMLLIRLTVGKFSQTERSPTDMDRTSLSPSINMDRILRPQSISRSPSSLMGNISRSPSTVIGSISRSPSTTMCPRSISRSPGTAMCKISRSPSTVMGSISRSPSTPIGRISMCPRSVSRSLSTTSRRISKGPSTTMERISRCPSSTIKGRNTQSLSTNSREAHPSFKARTNSYV